MHRNKKCGNNNKKKKNAEKEKGTRNNKHEQLRALLGEDVIEEVACENNAC